MLAAATPTVYRRLDRLAHRLEVGLRSAASASRAPVSINRVGSLLTVFFSVQPPRDLHEADATDSAAYGRFHRGLWDRGVFIPPSRFEAWFVSAALRRQDVDTVVRAARSAFAAAYKFSRSIRSPRSR
jgi:glutamate-1-semialdehyde 2,1-aminomutase